MKHLLAALTTIAAALVIALPATAQAWSVSSICQIEGGVPESELVEAEADVATCENALRAQQKANEQSAWASEEATRVGAEETRWIAARLAKGNCTINGPGQEKESAACFAQLAAKQAAIAAEDNRLGAEYEDAERAAHGRPVTHLSVSIRVHHGDSSESPGGTSLTVMATSFARVTIMFTRYGHSTERSNTDPISVDAYDLAHAPAGAPQGTCGMPSTWSVACSSTAPEPIPSISQTAGGVKWTCSRPGGTYHYVVLARSNVGPALVRRGIFKSVSVARCNELKWHEREAKERNARRYGEEVAQRSRAEREVLRRWEDNCRALGGTPVTLHTAEGSERACRAPGGGSLSVPE